MFIVVNLVYIVVKILKISLPNTPVLRKITGLETDCGFCEVAAMPQKPYSIIKDNYLKKILKPNEVNIKIPQTITARGIMLKKDN